MSFNFRFFGASMDIFRLLGVLCVGSLLFFFGWNAHNWSLGFVGLLLSWFGFLMTVRQHRQASKKHQRAVALLHDATKNEARAREAVLDVEMAHETFLATISHDIKSPLQIILANARIIESREGKSPTTKNAVGRLVRSTDHLLNMVDDLIERDGLKTGGLRITLEETDVASVVREVVATLSVQAEQKGLRVGCVTDSLDPLVWTDEHRLRQILWNLVMNSIRYTDRGFIDLVAWTNDDLVTGQGVSKQLIIEVRDSGIGIPDAMKATIFDPFVQAAEPRRGGSGLGLAMVRNIVDAMNGEIKLTSEQGAGSVFRIELPCTAPADQATSGQRQILLIDDDPEIRATMKDGLEDHGYQITEADTVEEAIAALRRRQYGVMPG